MRVCPPSSDRQSKNKRVLVIGLGNSERSDDGVGLAIVRRLKPVAPHWMTVRESSGDLTTLLDLWSGFDDVILIDAMHAGDAPGQMRWFDASESNLPEEPFAAHSTHDFGLSQAVAMARALGELPRTVHVVGVQGANFASGTTLVADVENAIDGVMTSILTRFDARESLHA